METKTRRSNMVEGRIAKTNKFETCGMSEQEFKDMLSEIITESIIDNINHNFGVWLMDSRNYCEVEVEDVRDEYYFVDVEITINDEVWDEVQSCWRRLISGPITIQCPINQIPGKLKS